ncbi:MULTISPECIES: hypothetical protein [Paenibacillus]|uniref:hypothetical protein n=1 Tax=Paenibacillus TaxID=44249 RepID=UPI0022B85B7D|nr:hypothetical protein [Paenibacillus caseinilyticus]
MLFKRKLSLWMFIIFVILMGITAIALVLNLNSLKKKHEEEIRKVISSNGGQVVKIEKVDAQISPFVEDYNKSNVVYKIIYRKSDTEHVAWYRGVNVVNNIHADNPTALQGGFGEKWIYQSDKK